MTDENKTDHGEQVAIENKIALTVKEAAEY